MRPLLAAALAAALAGAAPSAAGRDGSRLTVLAAASLTEVLPHVDPAPAYGFGGSNRLAFQIRRGAPADVFVSASRKIVQELFRAGLVERPRLFAANTLVLAVPRSNPARLRSVYGLRRPGVKLVVGTARVPVGVYTREALRRLGLTSVLARVVSREPDVKGIVGKLALGQADAGFVYRTDVRAASARLRAIALPARAQPRVRYEIAVVETSRRRSRARAWVEAVTMGARARRLLRRAGFVVP